MLMNTRGGIGRDGEGGQLFLDKVDVPERSCVIKRLLSNLVLKGRGIKDTPAQMV